MTVLTGTPKNDEMVSFCVFIVQVVQVAGCCHDIHLYPSVLIYPRNSLNTLDSCNIRIPEYFAMHE